MYKNIIFDLGGVVIDFNPRDFLLDYFMNKTAEDAVYDLTFGSKEWEDLDAGLITRAAANRIMLENAAQVGRTFEVQTVIDEWENQNGERNAYYRMLFGLPPLEAGETAWRALPEKDPCCSWI